MPLYSDNNYFTQIKIDQVTNPDHCLLCHMIEFSECYHTIYVVRFFHSIIAMPMPFCFNKTGGIFFLWVELNSLNNITPFRCGLNCASVSCVHDFSPFFFFFFLFSLQLLTSQLWIVHPYTVHRSHQLHFSATFSLKMDPTILFTHLKIISLQCFWFQFSVSTKRNCIQMDP